jgi:uncharacterized protein (DUF302 family)
MNINAAVDGLRILPTQHSVADVLGRVQSIARSRGLMIFAQIDFSGDAQRAGLALRPTGLVILGSPKAGTPLIDATPTVAIDLPLKILAWQDADGHTWVAYNDAAYIRARHRFPSELQKNIAAVAALTEAAAAQDP